MGKAESPETAAAVHLTKTTKINPNRIDYYEEARDVWLKLIKKAIKKGYFLLSDLYMKA